jgi:hypothetical protein
MALNMQIFQRTDNRENEARKATVVRKRHTHLHSKRKPKEDSKQSSQSHYNPHFNIKKNKHIHNTKPRCKKNRAMPVQLYEANHRYLMNMALIKTKLRSKPSSSIRQQPTATRIQRNRKPQKEPVERNRK